MQRMKVTVELDICHRDDLRPGEVVEDLVKLVNSHEARLLLQERRPYRYQESGWWMDTATLSVPHPDA